MSPSLPISSVRSRAQMVRDEAASLMAGLAFTSTLFFALAFFEHVAPAPHTDEIEELSTVSVPIEPPPPPPETLTPDIEAGNDMQPMTGLDFSPEESPVSVAVSPPPIEGLIPAPLGVSAPKARFSAFAIGDMKPRINLDADANHVFQESEVDQRPHAIVRVAPDIPSSISGSSPRLRVVLLLIIDQEGRARNVRVAKSSGNDRFDALIVSTVADSWLFAPGIRHGKKVKVLAQQGFQVVFSSSQSPFSTN